MELQISESHLKNMKGKHKTNNHSNPKINKKLLFKNTINDIFNGRKDLIFFKTNKYTKNS